MAQYLLSIKAVDGVAERAKRRVRLRVHLHLTRREHVRSTKICKRKRRYLPGGRAMTASTRYKTNRSSKILIDPSGEMENNFHREQKKHCDTLSLEIVFDVLLIA